MLDIGEKTYVVGTQKNHLTEMVPLSTQKHMPNIGEKKHSNLRKSICRLLF